MEHSIEYSENLNSGHYQPCSARNCATCFENHGCIHDQYMFVAQNVEEYNLEVEAPTVNSINI